MKTLVALLRAVNVGGTGLLPMRRLTEICQDAGFTDARTYIQSGNVVFRSRHPAERARATLEEALAAATGAHIDIVVRTAEQLRRVLEQNPFQAQPPARVSIFFCSDALPSGVMEGVTGPDGEQVVAGVGEFYVFYPAGMGRSKLKLPKLACFATARNINTVTKLVQMCGD